MAIVYHPEIIQGTEEWLKLRLGVLCASEVKLIITPKKLEYSSTDKEKAHVMEIAAQRITEYIEPSYISEDMMRGKDEEMYARSKYHHNYNKVKECGFITNDKWGFVIGYSPDGLVGNDGQIEIKSRKQKYQLQTIIEKAVPDEHIIQLQAGLLVSERQWCDYISYCGGMPMKVIRVYPDDKIQNAIVAAATEFYSRVERITGLYPDASVELVPTEKVSMEIVI